jgi:hypothetical protein
MTTTLKFEMMTIYLQNFKKMRFVKSKLIILEEAALLFASSSRFLLFLLFDHVDARLSVKVVEVIFGLRSAFHKIVRIINLELTCSFFIEDYFGRILKIYSLKLSFFFQDIQWQGFLRD